jgi:hypothetical protein
MKQWIENRKPGNVYCGPRPEEVWEDGLNSCETQASVMPVIATGVILGNGTAQRDHRFTALPRVIGEIIRCGTHTEAANLLSGAPRQGAPGRLRD